MNRPKLLDDYLSGKSLIRSRNDGDGTPVDFSLILWDSAIRQADKSDREELVSLLRNDSVSIPEHVRKYLADVLDGSFKIPPHNTRIKLTSRARGEIQMLAYDAARQKIATGRADKKEKAAHIARIAEETGAEQSVIKKRWSRHERFAEAFFLRKKKTQLGYTRTIVRDGKKVKMES
jgi:hypothetical protein